MKREPNIYFCGDTHGYKLHTEKLISFLLYTNKQTTKDDFMIQLGDFGWIWKKLDDDQKQLDFLEWIASQNITFCVVLGNHENYDEIEKLPIVEKFGGKVRVLKLKTGEIYFFERGEVYDIAGKKVFAFGGALSVDKEDRILGKTYWKQELPVIYEYSNALKNLKEHNFEVDMVVAHTCPSFLVRQMPDEVISIQKIEDPVAEFFDFIINVRNLKFKEWHFGHFHIDLKKELADFVFECHFRNIGQCKI